MSRGDEVAQVNDGHQSAESDGSNQVGAKPRLLLMGLKKSGKSSISNVVFRKMAPQDTLFLETTTTILKESMHTFMDFQVWDLPGQIDYLDSSFDTDSIFSGVGAMVWVLDAVDNYMEPIGRLTDIILHLQKSYPHIKYTVFIHKIDSLTEDIREETIRDVVQRISDELFDAGIENPPINYYGTSIFDHTIFEGLSRVMQGLVPQLPTFEALLNTMRASCHFEKVYLFDVYSKIYIASDTSPLDVNSYELCSDYIDLIVDMSEVYGWHRNKAQGSEAPQIPETQFAESHVANIKGYHLYLREINMNLAFIGISKDPNFEAGKSVRDQNIQTFQDTLLQILARAQQPEQMDQSTSGSATTGHSQGPV